MKISRKVSIAMLGVGICALLPSIVLGSTNSSAMLRDCSVTCLKGSCQGTGKCSCYCDATDHPHCDCPK